MASPRETNRIIRLPVYTGDSIERYLNDLTLVLTKELTELWNRTETLDSKKYIENEVIESAHIKDINADTITAGSIVGRTYKTSTSGARVELFPNSDTGIVAYDSNNVANFKVLVGGTNSGDIIIGSTTDGKYVQWDESEDTLKIKGKLQADEDSTTLNLATAIKTNNTLIESYTTTNSTTSSTWVDDYTFTSYSPIISSNNNIKTYFYITIYVDLSSGGTDYGYTRVLENGVEKKNWTVAADSPAEWLTGSWATTSGSKTVKIQFKRDAGTYYHYERHLYYHFEYKKLLCPYN